MDIRAFISTIKDEFYMWGTYNGVPWELHKYREIMEQVQGMSTPSTMHLLNLAVRHLGPDECYLEVGTWRGATLIGALLGNEAYGVAIDNDTMDEHDGDSEKSADVWWRNIIQFGLYERVEYINGSVPDAWSLVSRSKPVGVYFFDGDKSTEEAAYEGLMGVLPFLADEALIFVDDANELPIRLAVNRLERTYPQHAVKIFDLPTPGNCWPMWWNGIIAIRWHA